MSSMLGQRSAAMSLGKNASLSNKASMSNATGANTGLKGTGYNEARIQNFTPEQMQLFQQAFSQLGPESYLSKLAAGDESLFGQLEAPALRNFGALQGNIASRFSGMGSGARRSSGFQNTMGNAASELSERLASNRMNLQQQAIKDLMGMSSSLLQQRPYENFLIPQQKPFWQELLTSLSTGVGQGIGSLPMLLAL